VVRNAEGEDLQNNARRVRHFDQAAELLGHDLSGAN
jgi:hypothetical protein